MQIPGALLQSTESDFIKRLMNLNFEYSSQKIIMYTNGWEALHADSIKCWLLNWYSRTYLFERRRYLIINSGLAKIIFDLKNLHYLFVFFLYFWDHYPQCQKWAGRRCKYQYTEMYLGKHLWQSYLSILYQCTLEKKIHINPSQETESQYYVNL